MNKNGQVTSIIIFFVLAIAVLMTSIIILRMTNSILTPFQAQIGNVSVQAGQGVAYIHERFTTWWDYAVVLLLLLNVMILLVSAFLVDIHPAFLIVYILAIFFLFIFGNYALYPLDQIWNQMGTSVEAPQTLIEQFIINNFQMIMLGIVILSGIVMYSKFKLFGGQGTGGNY
jgi:hypothetical protein